VALRACLAGRTSDEQRPHGAGREAVEANEYITKPFNPDEILQKARDILHVPR
jgi:DNA-binding response OmpR family regulator